MDRKSIPGVLFVACGLLAVVRAQPDAAALLAGARATLGGEQALAAVKSFTVSGDHTRNLGGRSFTTMVEIACELPEKFLQEDNTVGMFSTLHRVGFNGDGLIDQTTTDGPAPPLITVSSGKETPDEIAARKQRAVLLRKQEFAKLMLALFAKDLSAYPLTFPYLGQAPPAEGGADVIEAKGQDGLTLHLYLDAKTHAPVFISWLTKASVNFGSTTPVTPMSSGPPPVPAPTLPGTAPPAPTPTQPPPGTIQATPLPPLVNPTPAELERRARLLKEQADAIAASSPPVEHRLVLGDFRDADGLHWPHRLTETVEGSVVDELKLGKFKVNARINPGRFKVSK